MATWTPSPWRASADAGYGALMTVPPPSALIKGLSVLDAVLSHDRLKDIAEAAGMRVHALTSPHLVRFAERIRVAGELITDEALDRLIDKVEAANAGQPISFFEISTVLALQAFAEHGVSIQTVDGSDVEDVTIENVRILHARGPISVRRGARGRGVAGKGRAVVEATPHHVGDGIDGCADGQVDEAVRIR